MIEWTTLLSRQPSVSKPSLSRAAVLEFPSLSRIAFVKTPVVDPAPVAEPIQGGWKPMELGRYRVTIAETLVEREAACRLRFKVFNIELGEGLQASYKTGLDTDHFDLFCDQLIVEDRNSHATVGTYRMQTGATAARNLGYYSEQEFDFGPYEPLRDSILELGRASIDREHRSSEVLTLLWRGIAQYTRVYRLRYLIGCSSVNSRDPRVGWQLFRQLSEYLAEERYRSAPTTPFTLPSTEEAPEAM